MAPHSQRNQQSKSDRQVGYQFSTIEIMLIEILICIRLIKNIVLYIDFQKYIQTSKPLMEKRRRERINRSLNDLKSILLEALRRDVSIFLTLGSPKPSNLVSK